MKTPLILIIDHDDDNDDDDDDDDDNNDDDDDDDEDEDGEKQFLAGYQMALAAEWANRVPTIVLQIHCNEDDNDNDGDDDDDDDDIVSSTFQKEWSKQMKIMRILGW